MYLVDAIFVERLGFRFAFVWILQTFNHIFGSFGSYDTLKKQSFPTDCILSSKRVNLKLETVYIARRNIY